MMTGTKILMTGATMMMTISKQPAAGDGAVWRLQSGGECGTIPLLRNSTGYGDFLIPTTEQLHIGANKARLSDLVNRRIEKFSGLGIPKQSFQPVVTAGFICSRREYATKKQKARLITPRFCCR